VATVRHNGEAAVTLSHTVNSVTAPEPALTSHCPRKRAGERWAQSVAERAINVAREGDVPRVWAEGLARLDRERPPTDVPLTRWLQFMDDAALFLNSPFCITAAAFGWGAHDLFGCDPDRPFARVDHGGLLWLLDGTRLIALTADTAVIETNTGTRQVWRRKPGDPARVVAWELTR
jgi:hypothetical protein